MKNACKQVNNRISENWTFIDENEPFFGRKLVNHASEIRQIPRFAEIAADSTKN